jgi:hypothetical protein
MPTWLLIYACICTLILDKGAKLIQRRKIKYFYIFAKDPKKLTILMGKKQLKFNPFSSYCRKIKINYNSLKN